MYLKLVFSMHSKTLQAHLFTGGLFFILCIYSPFVLSSTLTPDLINKIQAKQTGAQQLRFKRWAQIIQNHANSSESTKLKVVNDFFNSFTYRSDADEVGRQDYWMTPIEFIQRGGGDCEDYSIAKYFTLEAMGVSAEKLRITYVKAIKLNVAHMVLAYYKTPEAEPLVLDNLIPEIKPASQRTDLRPVYSFNGRGLWLARQRGQGRRISGSDRISVWRDLNSRMLRQLNV